VGNFILLDGLYHVYSLTSELMDMSYSTLEPLWVIIIQIFMYSLWGICVLDSLTCTSVRGIAGSRGNANFLRNCQSLSDSSGWVLLFLHIVISVSYSLSDNNHPRVHGVISNCGFDLYSPKDIIFSWTHWPFVCSLWRAIYSIFSHFNWIVFLFIFELEEFYMYSENSLLLAYSPINSILTI
jgi:uncharacterized membrane protein